MSVKIKSSTYQQPSLANFENYDETVNSQVHNPIEKAIFGNLKLTLSADPLSDLQNLNPNQGFETQQNQPNLLANPNPTSEGKPLIKQNWDSKLTELLDQKTVLEYQIASLQFQNYQSEQKLANLQKTSQQNQQTWQQEKLQILKQRAFWQEKAREKSAKLEEIQTRIDNLQKLVVATQLDKVYWQEQNLNWQARWTFYSSRWLTQEQKWQESFAKKQRQFLLEIKQIENKALGKERIWLASITIIFAVLTFFCLYWLRS